MDLNKLKLYELYELKRLLLTGELSSMIDESIKSKQSELAESYNEYLENLYYEASEEIYAPVRESYDKYQENLLNEVLKENEKDKTR